MRLPTVSLLALVCGCGPQLSASFDGQPLGAVSVCASCQAPEPCPAGQAAFPGEPSCAPLGARCDADAGFEADPSGWGCLAVLPSSPCTGATREAVGSRGCVPIGDCDAPFPPANASLFVDDSFTQTDATHFKSIEAAVVAAGPGAVIAIDEGTYAEAIIDPLDPMTLHGRCAEKVKVVGTGGNQVALYAYRSRGVVARGLTLTGHAGGVFSEGGELTLEDSVVEGNLAVGLFARNRGTLTVRRSRVSGSRFAGGELGAGVVSNTGSTVVLEDVAITGNDHRGLSVGGQGSSLSCTRCVVARHQAAAGVSQTAAGLLAVDSARLSFSGGAVQLSAGSSLYADGNATVTVSGSVLSGSTGRLADGAGLGVGAYSGAQVRLEQTTVADDPVIHLYAEGAGTQLTAVDSTVRGPPTLAGVEIGRGAQVTTGASLVAQRLAVARVSSAGLAFQNTAQGTMDHVAISDVKEINWPSVTMPFGGFGVLCEELSSCGARKLSVDRATLSGLSASQGGVMTVEDVVVRDVQRSTLGGGGNAGQVSGQGHLTAARSFFLRSFSSGFIVVGQGTLELRSCTIADSLPDLRGGFGHGVTAFRQGIALLTDTALLRNPGIALVTDDAQAQVVGGSIEGSSVALQAQNGSTVTSSDSTGALQPGELRVSTTTQFNDNQTRLGTGVVPLPMP